MPPLAHSSVPSLALVSLNLPKMLLLVPPSWECSLQSHTHLDNSLFLCQLFSDVTHSHWEVLSQHYSIGQSAHTVLLLWPPVYCSASPTAQSIYFPPSSHLLFIICTASLAVMLYGNRDVDCYLIYISMRRALTVLWWACHTSLWMIDSSLKTIHHWSHFSWISKLEPKLNLFPIKVFPSLFTSKSPQEWDKVMNEWVTTNIQRLRIKLVLCFLETAREINNRKMNFEYQMGVVELTEDWNTRVISVAHWEARNGSSISCVYCPANSCWV